MLCRLSRGGSTGSSGIPEASIAGAAADQGTRGMDLAAKMMQKMGWQSGLGLGRNKQVRPADQVHDAAQHNRSHEKHHVGNGIVVECVQCEGLASSSRARCCA